MATGEAIEAEFGIPIVNKRIIRDDGRYFNRQLFVRPTGEVTVYDKRHLFSIGGEDRSPHDPSNRS